MAGESVLIPQIYDKHPDFADAISTTSVDSSWLYENCFENLIELLTISMFLALLPSVWAQRR